MCAKRYAGSAVLSGVSSKQHCIRRTQSHVRSQLQISVTKHDFLLELFAAKIRTYTMTAAPNTADNKGYELPQSTIAVRSYNTCYGMV